MLSIGNQPSHDKKHRNNNDNDDAPPQELPIAKRPVSLKPAIKPMGFRPRDPRFDKRCGTFNNKIFSTTYTFIDDLKNKELNELEHMLRKEKDKTRKHQIKSIISRLKNQQVTERENKLREERLEILKKEKRQLLSNNEKTQPKRVFLSKTEVKKMNMVEKFKELKSSGKLTRYLERKRKKLINRDGRDIP